MTESVERAGGSASGEGLLTPLLQAQTYLNILYLLLAFPLGIFYFVFLVTGLSVGLSLIIIWIGIPILLLVLIGWWGMAAFERELAIRLLRVEIPPMKRETEPGLGLWARLKTYLGNPVTWKGLAYLFIKFPLGIFSFVVAITLVSVSLSFVAVPVAFPFVPEQILIEADTGGWVIDTFGEALLVGVVGLVLALLSVYLMNWLAYASGWLATVMLGDPKVATGEGEGRALGPKPTLPSIRMDAQTGKIAGAVMIGLGIVALVGQFVASFGQWFWPAVLIVIGLALVVPRTREIFAKADDEPESEPAENR
jgi:hypothetical protein